MFEYQLNLWKIFIRDTLNGRLKKSQEKKNLEGCQLILNAAGTGVRRHTSSDILVGLKISNYYWWTSKISGYLGKPVPTIIDEFLEKFQTAFDPPPPPGPFLGKM